MGSLLEPRLSLALPRPCSIRVQSHQGRRGIRFRSGADIGPADRWQGQLITDP